MYIRGMGQVTSSTPASCPLFQSLQANSSGVVSCTPDSGGGQLLMDIAVLPARLASNLIPALDPTLQSGLGIPAAALSAAVWLLLLSQLGGH
jgi:hypothetical protein